MKERMEVEFLDHTETIRIFVLKYFILGLIITSTSEKRERMKKEMFEISVFCL